MSKIGEDLLEGLREFRDHAAGRTKMKTVTVKVPAIDVKAIRKRHKITQAQFAARYGFTLGAVRDWEQKRGQPDRATRILLHVIDRQPDVVDNIVSEFEHAA